MSTGEGSTSFEDDGDTLDGWTVPGAPEGSPGNRNDWIATDQPTLQPSVGQIASDAFARQPEILDFLAGYFGKYPFEAAGGIVEDAPLGFALENQTRPIYSAVFFTDPVSADSVVVHELTHQWFGDDLRLGRWQDIWLNRGFATYAEWLWSEHEGLGTPQDNFNFFANVIPADDPFWALTIGDPGPVQLFDPPVYYRGAMTLHALRLRVGGDAFFRILRSWAKRQSGNAVSTGRVHRPRRVDLAPAARRPVRRVAVHARQAGLAGASPGGQDRPQRGRVVRIDDDPLHPGGDHCRASSLAVDDRLPGRDAAARSSRRWPSPARRPPSLRPTRIRVAGLAEPPHRYRRNHGEVHLEWGDQLRAHRIFATPSSLVAVARSHIRDRRLDDALGAAHFAALRASFRSVAIVRTGRPRQFPVVVGLRAVADVGMASARPSRRSSRTPASTEASTFAAWSTPRSVGPSSWASATGMTTPSSCPINHRPGMTIAGVLREQ